MVHINHGILAIKTNKIWLSAEMWMGLETVTQSEVSQKENHKYINAYMGNLQKQYRQSYLQGRNRETDIENRCMDKE